MPPIRRACHIYLHFDLYKEYQVALVISDLETLHIDYRSTFLLESWKICSKL